MSSKKGKSAPAKQVNPIVAEFQASCKALNFTEEDIMTDISNSLNQSETQIRLTHKNISPALGKVLLRLFQRYQRLQSITLYACVILDPAFLKQLGTDLVKSPLTSISLDYSPIQREALLPFLNLPSLDVLSLRGNQCLTPYDYISMKQNPFPQTLNAFYNALTTSNLKVLNLYGCHLGDDGTVALANALYFNSSLKCLCLSRNRVGDAGAAALASALSYYTLSEAESAIVDRLMNEESKQRISDEGGSLVKRKKGQKAPPKKAPPKTTGKKGQPAKAPTERLLNFDPTTPVMAAVLAKWNTCVTKENGSRVLPGNTTLSTLILDENQITGTGAAKLGEMLKENSHIVHFTIANNPEIEPSEEKSLTRVIQE